MNNVVVIDNDEPPQCAEPCQEERSELKYQVAHSLVMMKRYFSIPLVGSMTD